MYSGGGCHLCVFPKAEAGHTSDFSMCVSHSYPALLLKGLGALEPELPRVHNEVCLSAPEHHVQMLRDRQQWQTLTAQVI